MVNPSHDEEDIPADPSLESRNAPVPFEHDEYWVEVPGGMWTPELEHKHMPLRDPTPAELADTERKRGSSEDETCPIDPLLANLDFTSEYISPIEQDKIFKDKLQQYYDHLYSDDDFLDYLDWEKEL